jgi:DNA-binding NarL/FixJ family response regulator
MIRVLIVDDHPLFRDGLVALLRSVPDIDIIDAVGDGQRRPVRRGTRTRHRRDGPQPPGISGMEAIRRILAHDPVRASWCSRWSTTTMR